MIFSTFLSEQVMEDLVLMVARYLGFLPIGGEHGLVGEHITRRVRGFCHSFVIQPVRQIKLDVQEVSY